MFIRFDASSVPHLAKIFTALFTLDLKTHVTKMYNWVMNLITYLFQAYLLKLFRLCIYIDMKFDINNDELSGTKGEHIKGKKNERR